MAQNTINTKHNPVFLFRKASHNKDEYAICSSLFPTFTLRNAIPENSLVIGRYSVLPYYNEVVQDLQCKNSSLINDLYQHEYIANMDYYYDIEQYTFKTWLRLEDVPFSYRNNAFIVKGKTNSKKQQWATHMYADNFKQAVNVACELQKDSMISQQGIVIREYVPLETFEQGLNEMPMTNEWRLFYYKDKLLAHSYYWNEILDESNFYKVDNAKQEFKQKGMPFANEVAKIIAENTNFFVIDIAKTVEGRWIVVEINDGQMSGLNGVSALNLYVKLMGAID